MKGHDIDIRQVEAGQLRGRLHHALADDVSISFGRFSKGLRSRGFWSPDKVVLGLLLEGDAYRGMAFFAGPARRQEALDAAVKAMAAGRHSGTSSS